MFDINHLASLAGLKLSTQEQEQFSQEFPSILKLLDKVKNFDITPTTKTWHEIIDMETQAHQGLTPDSSPQALLDNIEHPLVGQAIELPKFVD